MRTTTPVIDKHLQCFVDGDLDGILADDAPQAVLFTPEAALRGHDAIRGLFVATGHRHLLRARRQDRGPVVRRPDRVEGQTPQGSAGPASRQSSRRRSSRVAARSTDGAGAAETDRPHAAAGADVPTATPAVPQWGHRKPWMLEHAAQFRPAPPPDLTGPRWATDFNETKAYGGRSASQRTPAQTEVARFWESSLPEIYHGVLRSAARQPGRSLLRHASLVAVAAQAMDDALIAVFDAKYPYGFWRPVTAIRNADADHNPATEADPGWVPMINPPMHPEYPSAHSILAATAGTVIAADAGTATLPLETRSPSAQGVTRRWAGIDELVREVSEARVLEGVHFRFSTVTGEAMGRQIGALAARRLLRPDL